MSYTTVEQVTLFANRGEEDLSFAEQAQMASIIQYVDGVINNYCGWNMLPTDYVDKRYNGSGTSTLDLRLYPINTITQARVRGTDGVFTDVTADIEILEGGVIGFLPGSATTSFAAGNLNWFLTFNAGFAPIPYELAYVATYLSTTIFNKVTQETLDLASEGFEQKTQTYASVELTTTVRRTLDRYRMVSIF